jgi:Tfp pilus assembly protein PilZ
LSQEAVERRSEFRFPVVLPVEYQRPHESGVLSYCLDLSKAGTFISSDNHPMSIGSRFGMHFTIPVAPESSEIFRTEGTVVWKRIQAFKSKRNGMGVKFIEPIPEDVLLNALADNVGKLMKETVLKRKVEKEVEELESELEETKKLATLGGCAEKFLSDLSRPIFTLSMELDTMKREMKKYKKLLEAHEETNNAELKNIIREFANCHKEIDQTIKDYRVISNLAYILRDNGHPFEWKLKKYNG